MIDPTIRSTFPILDRRINGMPIVYLDSASTSLKPRTVTDAIRRYHEEFTANVHRSTHHFGEEATLAYEEARNRVARFVNARPDEIVFVRNATEAINLVASGLELGGDDEVVITALEHHSNQLPWLARSRIRTLPTGGDGLPDSARLCEVVNSKTRLLAASLLSNVTGTGVDLAAWRVVAAERGIPLLVDAAQAAGHRPLDVAALGCDFLALSGHKVLGPSGIGALWGRRERLENLRPSLFGGGMVHASREDRYELKEVPWRFEAGTPNIEGALGFAAALDFIDAIGMEHVAAHSLALGRRLFDGLSRIERIRLVAPTVRDRFGIASFAVLVPGLSAEAFGRLMADAHAVLLSAGRHCAHPYHDLIEAAATVRASTHVYTTDEEIDRLIAGVRALTA